MHYLLRYEYVPDILSRREPHRAAHLSSLSDLHKRGIVTHAGAAGDPVDHAVIVFKTDDRTIVDDFVRADPYILNGLVTSWRVDPWNLVIGA